MSRYCACCIVPTDSLPVLPEQDIMTTVMSMAERSLARVLVISVFHYALCAKVWEMCNLSKLVYLCKPVYERKKA